MSQPELKLYHLAAACSLAALLALEESGHPYSILTPLLAEGRKLPEFLAASPTGQVPCLLVYGRPMRAFFTSPIAAILSTLAGRWFDLTGSYRIAFGGTGTVCLLAASVFVLFLRPPHTAQGALDTTAADEVTTTSLR